MILRTSTIAILILATPSLVFGADTPTMGSMLLKMTWALCIVAGLILILYGLLRRKMGLPASGRGTAIKIIEVKPIMYKNALALIQVHDREMLVGISQNGIHMLSEVTTPTGAPQSRSTFEETLKQQQ